MEIFIAFEVKPAGWLVVDVGDKILFASDAVQGDDDRGSGVPGYYRGNSLMSIRIT